MKYTELNKEELLEQLGLEKNKRLQLLIEHNQLLKEDTELLNQHIKLIDALRYISSNAIYGKDDDNTKAARSALIGLKKNKTS